EVLPRSDWVAELTEPLSESNRLVWVSKSSLGIWLAQISDVNGGWRGRKSLCFVYRKLYHSAPTPCCYLGCSTGSSVVDLGFLLWAQRKPVANFETNKPKKKKKK
ncbi:hypothetical protein PanWU01x14_133950, partial [Parasponia andersonii]